MTNMENFSFEVDTSGIATITFDMPGRSFNTITQSVQRDLDVVVERLRSDPAIVGGILRSGKSTGFCAGADLKEMVGDIERWRCGDTPEERLAGVADASGLSRRIRALEACGKPVVAIVEGLALGGGLELVLGCHRRLAVDDATLMLRFPEVELGLLPGAGGTQRLPRLMGLVNSMPYLLDGTPITLEDALACSIVHQALPAGALVDAARKWILDDGTPVAPWDEKGFRIPGGGPHTPAGYMQFGPAMASRLAGGYAPAAAAILKCLYEGVQVPIDAGLRIESRYFYNTARSQAAGERVQAFLARK